MSERWKPQHRQEPVRAMMRRMNDIERAPLGPLAARLSELRLRTAVKDAVRRMPSWQHQVPVAEPEDGLVWLYFIQAGDAGPIKIGVSADPLRRLANLQTSNHERLRLVAVARVSIETEGDIHDALAEHRLHGEWFQPAPAVLAEVARQEAKGYRAWLEAA